MQRVTLMFAFLLVTVIVYPTQSSAGTQTIPLPEVSGAVNIGNDRVMLVADEGYQVQVVSHADATFSAGDSKSFSSNMKPLAPTINDSKKVVGSSSGKKQTR